MATDRDGGLPGRAREAAPAGPAAAGGREVARAPAAKLGAEDFAGAEAARLAQLRVIGRRWRALQTRLNTVTTLVNAYQRRG